jgi:parvulin-like peptidyl-prolyl cis-trans isomerase-like protein
MRKSWLMCVLLGTLAWGQAAPGTPPPATGSQAPSAGTGSGTPPPGARAQGPGMSLPPKAPPPPDTAAAVPPDAPVITVKGVCPATPKTAPAKTGAAKTASPAAKTPAGECKTVITKAEFEKLASGLSTGNMTPQLRRQLASILPRLIAMSDAAKKKGLEKSERYQETLKFAKMQILTNELTKSIQEDATKVPQADIDAYYKEHPEAYQQFNLDRLFVPRTKQAAESKEADSNKDEKLTEEQQKAKEAADKAREEQGEQEMTKLADALRARAIAGEDFMKLQKEAFEAAGMKIDSPTVNLPKLRRTGLPPAHAAVFDLKVGEVSQVISDSGGHYMYKVNSKETLPLDQVKDEIHNTLQTQRSKAEMDKYQNSFTVETNEMYFGPPGPGGMHPMPPPRIPNPHVAPGPIPPPGAPQNQPQAQPQAPPPAAKPN